VTPSTPATVRRDRLRRKGTRRRAARRARPAGGRHATGGADCLGGCFGRYYVVGYRDAGTGPIPPTPVVLASCSSRGEALALRARFRTQLPQYAGVVVERSGG
jgi:hypothetical protein